MSVTTSGLPNFRLLLAATLLVAGISACSVASLGYSMAPQLAVEYADDYLDLDYGQKERALELFKARKALHEKDELPQYAIFLADLEARLQGEVTQEDFDYAFDRTTELWRLGVRRTVPAIAALLADLDEDQLETLDESLAESEERYRERIENHDPEERREDRFEDIEEWTGALSEGQREFLDERLSRLNDTRVEWLEWRIERNQRLMALLREKPGKASIEEFLLRSWVGREEVDAELDAATDENRRIYRRMLVDLADMLDQEQKDNVAAKLAEYREIVWDLLPEEEQLVLENREARGGSLEDIGNRAGGR